MVYSSTGKIPFEIVYGKIPRSGILTLNEVIKYSTTWESFAKGINGKFEEVTKSLASEQAYQAHTYNKSIVTWSTRSVKKYNSGLKISQLSDFHENWIGNKIAPTVSLKK